MKRFNKEVGGAFKRLMSKKKIPPPTKATQKKLISTNTKDSNEDLYMLASSAFFFTGTIIQTKLSDKREIFELAQAEDKRNHDIKMQKAEHEHQLQMKADEVKSTWTKVIEGFSSFFNHDVKSAMASQVVNEGIKTLTKPVAIANSSYPCLGDRVFLLLLISVGCYSTYYKIYFIIFFEKLYLILLTKKK
jgi:hypothetical protein